LKVLAVAEAARTAVVEPAWFVLEADPRAELPAASFEPVTADPRAELSVASSEPVAADTQAWRSVARQVEQAVPLEVAIPVVAVDWHTTVLAQELLVWLVLPRKLARKDRIPEANSALLVDLHTRKQAEWRESLVETALGPGWVHSQEERQTHRIQRKIAHQTLTESYNEDNS
jgi:hypothetical protein